MAIFEIKRSTNEEYFFNLYTSDDDRITLRSETYKSKSSCEKGIQSVKTNASLQERYDLKVATNGKYYFNLKAGNGEIIGTSRLYNSIEARDMGIASVKAEAPDATIADLS